MDFSFLSSPQSWLTALIVFGMCIGSMGLDTTRVIFVVRGAKLLAWLLGFFSSSAAILTLGFALVQVKENPLAVVSYAAGWASGNVLGIIIEKKLAIGHIQLSIVSPNLGSAIVENLRLGGFAVTEIPARGKDGTVSMLQCSVLRRDANEAEKLIKSVDPNAFITAEEIRPVLRGYWRK